MIVNTINYFTHYHSSAYISLRESDRCKRRICSLPFLQEKKLLETSEEAKNIQECRTTKIVKITNSAFQKLRNLVFFKQVLVFDTLQITFLAPTISKIT